MTDEEIFNSVTESLDGFGPRLDLTSVNLTGQSVLRREANRARSLINSAIAAHPNIPPIHFDWVNSPHLNACAFNEQGKYFIGVTIGSVFIIQNLFSRLLSDSRFLDHIGNPEDESEQPPIEGWRPNAQAIFDTGTIPIIPRNAVRRQYALHLEQEFMSFLVAHELAHIVNGHIAYTNAQYGRSMLPEGAWIKGDDEPPIVSQTLEMDADCGAVSVMIGTIYLKLTELAYRPPPPWEQFYKTPSDALFNWAIAVSMFFRLFGDESFKGKDDLFERSYPPVRVRQMMAAGTASTYIMTKWDENMMSGCLKAIADGAALVERAFPLMTNTPISIQGLRESWDGSGMAHTEKLLDYWKNVLRSELLPYAYGNLPE